MQISLRNSLQHKTALLVFSAISAFALVDALADVGPKSARLVTQLGHSRDAHRFSDPRGQFGAGYIEDMLLQQVVYSANGKQVVTFANKTAILWDASSGRDYDGMSRARSSMQSRCRQRSFVDHRE